MAKDVITRFKLETTAFDSKIKQAAKGLSDYSKTATNAGKDFDKFTKSNVEAARALGTMTTSSNNAKGKVQELVGAYNELVKTYEHLTNDQKQSDFAKAMAESLTILDKRIKDAKQELYGLGDAAEQLKSKSSGLFGDGGFTGMLAVTGGNLLASGIQKLGSEMADTIQQSVELARQGEGVRIAFERLNRPDLLDNLKEATHGTVSELELMKAAVKFDDFKLPVEQLGTLLAFAQKKAKDTGQSVDYMVDSIVTGLGRKSLPILDNLGLSSAEIKEKIAETGDMTKAVAEIIKKQMSEAGEYVETAADRAARAAADATNEMERLGREAQPFAEAWAGVWNEIKIGGMDLLTTVFGPLAESARQIRNILNGGGFKFRSGITNLADGPAPSTTRKPGSDHKVQAPGGYVVVTDSNTGEVLGGQHFNNLQDTNSINTWKKSLFKTGSSSRGGKTTKTPTYDEDSLAAQQAEVRRLTKLWQESGEAVRGQYLQPLVDAEKKLQQMTDNMTLLKERAKGFLLEDLMNVQTGVTGVDKTGMGSNAGVVNLDFKVSKEELDDFAKNFADATIKAQKEAEKEANKTKESPEYTLLKDFNSKTSQMVGGLQSVNTGLRGLGLEIPKGVDELLNMASSMMQVMNGLQSIIGVIGNGSLMANTAAINANTYALMMSKMTGGLFFGMSGGGIVPRAEFGRVIPGNSFSGDNVFAGNAWVNSGELVLNRSEQGVLASLLDGGGSLGNLQLETRVDAEDLIIMLNSNGLRRGLGRLING